MHSILCVRNSSLRSVALTPTHINKSAHHGSEYEAIMKDLLLAKDLIGDEACQAYMSDSQVMNVVAYAKSRRHHISPSPNSTAYIYMQRCADMIVTHAKIQACIHP